MKLSVTSERSSRQIEFAAGLAWTRQPEINDNLPVSGGNDRKNSDKSDLVGCGFKRYGKLP